MRNTRNRLEMSWPVPAIDLSSRLQLVSDLCIIKSTCLEDDTGQHGFSFGPDNCQALAAGMVDHRLAAVTRTSGSRLRTGQLVELGRVSVELRLGLAYTHCSCL